MKRNLKRGGAMVMALILTVGCLSIASCNALNEDDCDSKVENAQNLLDKAEAYLNNHEYRQTMKGWQSESDSELKEMISSDSNYYASDIQVSGKDHLYRTYYETDGFAVFTETVVVDNMVYTNCYSTTESANSKNTSENITESSLEYTTESVTEEAVSEFPSEWSGEVYEDPSEATSESFSDLIIVTPSIDIEVSSTVVEYASTSEIVVIPGYGGDVEWATVVAPELDGIFAVSEGLHKYPFEDDEYYDVINTIYSAGLGVMDSDADEFKYIEIVKLDGERTKLVMSGLSDKFQEKYNDEFVTYINQSFEIIFDSEGRYLSVKASGETDFVYKYDNGNEEVVEKVKLYLYSEIEFEYENIEITAPENADEYILSETKWKQDEENNN